MRAWVHCVATIAAGLPIVGCADGLVYGERTSFSVASLRLNDDPAQPVAVKLGFNRDVVLVAPPIGGSVVEKDVSTDGKVEKDVSIGGEAVSQFSTFTVKSTTPFVPDPLKSSEEGQDQLLGVQSRFASGEAAIAIAETPKVVAAFMGVVVGDHVTEECVTGTEVDRFSTIQQTIKNLDGTTATTLANSPPTPTDKKTLSDVDPRNRRATDEKVARDVLQETVSDLTCANYSAWEKELGITP